MYEPIRVASKPHARPDITICFIFSDKTLHHCDQELDARNARRVSDAIKRNDVKGDVGEFTIAHGHEGALIGIVGLGKQSEFNLDRARAAAGGMLKGIRKLAAHAVEISVPVDAPFSVNSASLSRAFGEGLGLSNYRFDDFKKRSDKNGVKGLNLAVSSAEFADGLRRGIETAQSANYTRRLAATPPNVATTTYIAEQAQKLANEAGNLKCAIIAGQKLRQARFAGLENVGKASEHPPCMIELSYTPKGKFDFTLLLIGKTICYDTGGLSIKPREGMRGMKYDKCGGMAVLGAMHAVSRLKPKFRIIGLLPTAENSISHNALRVDDIIHYPNGVTVEVTNTDAEGRLVLADALIYGVKEFAPAAVIDLATLTGGVVVGLGRTYAGYWCEDASLRYRLETAAEESGEKVWRLPLHEDYKELMKAKHADIWNSAPVRDAHPIQGAAFLSNFIDEKIPWAHIDIAGTADSDKDRAPLCSGPTGFGVRLLANLIENWA